MVTCPFIPVQLRQRLNSDELKEFAVLLRAYRSALVVEDYVAKLKVLFGRNRYWKRREREIEEKREKKRKREKKERNENKRLFGK